MSSFLWMQIFDFRASFLFRAVEASLVTLFSCGDSAKFLSIYSLGVGLAISRDGSSGGVIRLAAINKDGVERFVLTGNQVPTFYEDY